METIILYKSKHGACQEVAQLLMHEKAECMSIDDFQGDLEDYEQIVLGCSVYAGMLDKSFTKLIEDNESTLLNKRVLFFIVGITKDDHYALKVLQDNSISTTLLAHVSHLDQLGGRLPFPDLNMFEKTIIKLINKKAQFCQTTQYKENVDLLAYDKIDRFKKVIQ